MKIKNKIKLRYGENPNQKGYLIYNTNNLFLIFGNGKISITIN